ncbi:hypothetical protein D1BOALGB6SA_8461 [Olavius sp. associated proteobacterium Delta 1]|nr:hypothetical protein D1BOALGB6SA_8461 [Olavius sp. associated proteobacterium Delta 1]
MPVITNINIYKKRASIPEIINSKLSFGLIPELYAYSLLVSIREKFRY